MSIDPNNLSQYTKTFGDEFNTAYTNNTPNLWNGSSGTWSTVWFYNGDGTPGSYLGNESEIYVNNNFTGNSSVSSTTDYLPWQVDPITGILTLTASPMPQYFQTQYHNAYGTNPTHFSGMVNTYHSHQQQFGYFEASIQFNAQEGFWPAFWLVDPDNSPGINPEIDVMEAPGQYVLASGSQYYGNYSSTVHDVSLPYPFAPYGLPGDGRWTTDGGGGLDGQYHTYGVDWEPGFITFYLDGHVEFRTPTPENMTTDEMYMILNLAVGGDGGTVDPNATDQMHIDYVHAYQSNEGAPVTTSGATFDASTQAANATRLDIGVTNEIVTGNSNADLFYLGDHAGDLPTGVVITNFNPAKDTLDLAGWMAHSVGQTSGFIYNYENPGQLPGQGSSQQDGYITLQDDGSGNVDVYVDLDGRAGGSNQPVLVAVLQGLSASQLMVDTHADVVATSASGSSVSTAQSPYTAPAGVTDITLTGSSSQTIYGNNDGDTFHSNNNGNTLIGGTGNDTFDMGRGGDWATGNGGTDTFAYANIPWAGGGITDFDSADKVDLSALLQVVASVDTVGYHYGDDPFAAQVLRYITDGSGNVVVQASYQDATDNNTGWWTVATLDNVTSASSLNYSNGLITEASSTVNVPDANYTAPANVTVINLTGTGPQAIDASATNGVTINSTDNGNSLIGGAGNDVFHIGRGGDWVTGNTGADTFAYANIPWAAGGVTDFTPSQGDDIDLTAMLQVIHSVDTVGYHYGDDPFAAQVLRYTTDGSGNVVVQANYQDATDNNTGWWTVATLDNVTSTSSLSYSNGHIT